MYIKPTFRSLLFKIKSNKGFSITEVMVASGLISIISIGVINLISNMQKEQRRNVLLQVLTSKKVQIENLIKNQTSWTNTISAATNTNMACLRLQKRCDGSDTLAPTNMVDNALNDVFRNSTTREIALYDSTSTTVPFANGRQSSNTSGFTESGQTCTGFSYNPATGNDACPIGYVINWRATTNAINPQIYVVAKLVYNPSNASPFKKFLNASDIVNDSKLNNKYDVNIIRTATTTSKTFVVNSSGLTSAGSDCDRGGFGTCASGLGTSYVGYTEGLTGTDGDVHDIVAATGNAATHFTIKETGSYKCTVTTYAFATNGVTALLMSGTPAAPISVLGTTSSMASNMSWGYATIIMQATFDVPTVPLNVFVKQICDTTPSTNPSPLRSGEVNINKCALGFATGTYGASTANKASIHCVQIIEK
jgi:type II secretory pathway pseudopilin PulG